MTHYKILNRWTNAVIYEGEAETLGALVGTAVRRGANLRGADLRDANLRGANLGDANLRDANLGDANLRGADLGGANLRGADLRDANLGDANLRGADLRDANLGDANLRGADLGGANLRDANLRDANRRGANLGGANLGEGILRAFRTDMFDILLRTRAEVPALRAALLAGEIDGSVYEGECACLVGTLANARDCDYHDLPGITPDSTRPAEQWFLMITRGDTPETNSASKQALAWVDEFLALTGDAVLSPEGGA